MGRTIYRDNYQGVPGNKDDEMAKLISNSRYGMFRFQIYKHMFLIKDFLKITCEP